MYVFMFYVLVSEMLVSEMYIYILLFYQLYAVLLSFYEDRNYRPVLNYICGTYYSIRTAI